MKFLKLSFCVFCIFLIIYFLLWVKYKISIYKNTESILPQYAALVLGAGLSGDHTPSDILNERIKAGVELYKLGKVKKLIMSGDNRFQNYNEPDAMKNRALELGIPEKDIIEDFAGRRTFDSCWRVKNIFSQDKIIIVTQNFHMLRSLFLCDELNIKTTGYIAKDAGNFIENIIWSTRDIIGTFVWTIEVHFAKPGVGGQKISI